MGDRFLSNAGAGRNCARSARSPDPRPVLNKHRAPMGPESLSSTWAGVWRKAPMAFPDSNSVLDAFQPAIKNLSPMGPENVCTCLEEVQGVNACVVILPSSRKLLRNEFRKHHFVGTVRA